jgi:hypothetical protein
MVATVVAMNASATITRASMDTKMTSFNGLKACDRVSSRRNVLSVAPSTVRARAGRSSVVVEARKVAVLGAGGGIGQPLSLLLKMNEKVTELALYDIANVKGVAADLSHCNTPSKVRRPIMAKTRSNIPTTFLSIESFT